MLLNFLIENRSKIDDSGSFSQLVFNTATAHITTDKHPQAIASKWSGICANMLCWCSVDTYKLKWHYNSTEMYCGCSRAFWDNVNGANITFPSKEAIWNECIKMMSRKDIIPYCNKWLGVLWKDTENLPAGWCHSVCPVWFTSQDHCLCWYGWGRRYFQYITILFHNGWQHTVVLPLDLAFLTSSLCYGRSLAPNIMNLQFSFWFLIVTLDPGRSEHRLDWTEFTLRVVL